jgi:hypothetical protein
MLARSAVLSTKDTRPNSWRRAWRRASWTRALFGRILRPSTADHGAALWIASLAVTRANRSRTPVCVLESGILATFGPTFEGSLIRFDRRFSSSKTLQGTLPWDSTELSETSSDLVTRSSSEYFQRKRSAQATRESGYLYSPAAGTWPTATVGDSQNAARETTSTGVSHPGTTLVDEVRKWGTPTAGTNDGNGQLDPTRPSRIQDQSANWPTPGAMISNDGEDPAVWEARRARLQQKGYNGNGAGIPLAVKAAGWPTPRAEDSESCGNHPSASDSLTGVTRNWNTPRARDGKLGGKDCLEPQAQLILFVDELATAPETLETNWQTPATDSFRSTGGDRKDEMGLDQQARTWPTPTTPHGGPESKQSKATRPESGGIDLQTLAREFRSPEGEASIDSPSSPQDPESLTCGKPSSKSTQRLNPQFVEWLMGWPIGWTDSGSRVTGLCQYRQRMRSLLFGLVSGMAEPRGFDDDAG